MISIGWKLVENKNSQIQTVKIKDKNILDLNVKNILNFGPVTCARFISRDVYNKFSPINCFDKKGNYIDAHDKRFFLFLTSKRLTNKVIDRIGYTSLKHPSSRTHNDNLKTKISLYRQDISILCDSLFFHFSFSEKLNIILNMHKVLLKIILMVFVMLSHQKIVTLLIFATYFRTKK